MKTIVIYYDEKPLIVEKVREFDAVKFLQLQKEALDNRFMLLDKVEDFKKEVKNLHDEIELLKQEIKLLKGEE